MMKRILGGAAAAGLALSLLSAGSANAACPTGTQSAVVPLAPAAPGTGSQVYGAQTGTTGGYIGVTGSTGYIEVGGSQASGVYARGSANGQPVNGEIIAGPSAQKVCVADRTVK